MKRGPAMVGSLVAAFVLLLAVNLIATVALRNMKLDLTEGNLFTLSEGSKAMLGKMEDRVKLKLFYSKRVASSIPAIKQYGERVIALLKQYENAADGMLSLEIIEPRPDEESEEWALKFGLQPVNFAGMENMYFGLAIESEVGAEQALPFLHPNREAFLEYDISQLIATVGGTAKKKIGLMTPLSVMGGFGNDPMARFQGRPPAEPWVIAQGLRNSYEVEELGMTPDAIGDDIDLLIVIHPKDITPEAEYAIDQYLVKGGRALILTDPLCEFEQANFQSPDPNARFSQSFGSTLPTLFPAWGLDLSTSKIVGDLDLATPLGQAGQKHIQYLTLSDENCDQEQIISANLERLLVGTAGVINADNALYDIVPLIESSETAMALESFMLQFGSNPEQLIKDYVPGDHSLAIAIKMTGKLATAFPAGPPGDDEQPDDAERAEHVAEAEQETTVVIISDVDMITDRLSFSKQQFFGQTIATPINQNVDFAFNAIENLMGSQDLINLRTRGKSARPFTVVDDLERSAQKKYRAEEEALQRKVDETNQRLTELQRGQQEGQGRAIISQEQKTEIDNLRAEVVVTKGQLREVRRDLRRDIESLGVRLKFINIVLFPVLVIALSFFPIAWRSFRVKSARGQTT